MRQVIEANGGLVARVGRLQAHMAAALGTHGPHVRLEAMLRGERGAVVADGHGQEVVLDVRVRNARLAADEAAGLEMVGRSEAIATQQPTRANERLRKRVHHRIQGDGLFAGHLEVELQMVLQVLAHTGQVVHHRQTECPQFFRRADTGKLQQLRRVDGAAAQDDLATRLHLHFGIATQVDHARGATPGKNHPAHPRLGTHFKVLATHGRTQIGIGRAATHASPHRHVHAAEALLLVTIHVVGGRITGLLRGFQPCGMQRIPGRAIRGGELALSATIVRRPFGTGFRLLEIRQHIRVAPARGAAFVAPALEVVGVATNVDETIDGRRAAQHLATRRVQTAPAEAGLRLGVVVPVVLFHVHRNRQRRRHLDEHGTVGTAVFQQQHGGGAVFGESVRQHAASGARTHDDVVVGGMVGTVLHARKPTPSGIGDAMRGRRRQNRFRAHFPRGAPEQVDGAN